MSTRQALLRDTTAPEPKKVHESLPSLVGAGVKRHLALPTAATDLDTRIVSLQCLDVFSMKHLGPTTAAHFKKSNLLGVCTSNQTNQRCNAADG